MCGNVNELMLLNDSLHKENAAKDREIRQLNKDVQQYEQTIMNLRNEISLSKYHTPNVSKMDAEVMAVRCCSGTKCGEWEPVKDYNTILCEETLKYQERIQKMETKVKSSSDSVRALRKANVSLNEELHALRTVCAALGEQCRTATMRGQFKDEIIREMRRQLQQAKAKATSCQEDTFTAHVKTSTPNASREACNGDSPDVSIIEPSTSDPIVVSDASIDHFEDTLLQQPTANPAQKGCILKKSPSSHLQRCVLIQTSNKHTKSEECGVKELYFNGQKHDNSDRERCVQGECTHTLEDSVGRSSVAESASGSCETGARADYYHGKLLATMQILQNKEETVRVQAESLAVAEARIAALTKRGIELRADNERKDRELQSLRKVVQSSRTDKTEVSITSDMQEMENQKIVSTLQNNLCVIEDIYRECFYETAKQEGLIDMLRKSYLDVRLREKEKSDHIGRLQNVINTQKWSLERCQDIAAEVDSLKLEIFSFLNSSNNDSGMWERSEASVASGVSEDLQDIVEQLLHLRELLTSDCTCGLEVENMRLKQNNKTMEIQIGELRQTIRDLQANLQDKGTVYAQCNEQINMKEKELHSITQQLTALEEESKNRNTDCDTLARQLQQAQVLVTDKSAELAQVQRQCETHDATIQELREELDRADCVIKEKCKMSDDLSQMCGSRAVSDRQVRMLQHELTQARAHADHLAHCYREKASSAAELEGQLEEAHARGKALCAHAHAAVAAVRTWTRRMRNTHRELEARIKEKEELLCTLQRRLEERQNYTQHTSGSENEPSCSRCLSSRAHAPSCCSSTVEARREGASEIASCPSALLPPRRPPRKKMMSCRNKQECSWGTYLVRDASVQRPQRRHAGVGPAPDQDTTTHCARADASRFHVHHISSDESPFPLEELLSRVEQYGAAANDARRRWSRERLRRDHT